jgi:hypothetical protein
LGAPCPGSNPEPSRAPKNADRSATLNPQRSNRIPKSENSKPVKYAG